MVFTKNSVTRLPFVHLQVQYNNAAGHTIKNTPIYSLYIRASFLLFYCYAPAITVIIPGFQADQIRFELNILNNILS